MARPRTVSDEEILTATMTAIGRHGPARVTLAKVAQEVGLSAAALVQRFGSKVELLRAAAAQGPQRVTDTFAEARASTSSPVEALLSGLAAFAGGIGSRDELTNHIGMLQVDLADPQMRSHAATQAQMLRADIADLLRAAVSEDELDTGDPAALADTVYTTYNGALITWAIDGAGPLGDWIRARVDAVLDPYRRRA